MPITPPRINYEFIDPDKNPGLVKRYDVTQDGTTIFEAGDKESRITTTYGGGRHQRPDQGHPGPEKGHLFPRRTRRGAASTETGDNGFATAKTELEKLGYEVKKQTPGPGRPLPQGLRPARRPRPAERPPAERTTRRSGPIIQGGGRVLFMVDPETETTAAVVPGRIRLQARQRHRRRHGVPAPRRRLFHARRQRIRGPRHHAQVRLRDLLPLRPVGRDRRDEARRRDAHGPGQDEPQLLGRAGAQRESRSSSTRPRTGRARSLWPRWPRSRSKPAKRPVPPRRKPDGARPTAAKSGGKRGPHRRRRRLRLRQEPLLRPLRERQFLPQRRQLADRGIRPHLHPAQDPDAADDPAHALPGAPALPRQHRHPAAGRPGPRGSPSGSGGGRCEIQDDPRPASPSLVALLAVVLFFDPRARRIRPPRRRRTCSSSLAAADIHKDRASSQGRTGRSDLRAGRPGRPGG